MQQRLHDPFIVAVAVAILGTSQPATRSQPFSFQAQDSVVEISTLWSATAVKPGGEIDSSAATLTRWSK